jgi:hypothetical protein
MSRLPNLLKRLKDLQRQYVDLEHQIAAVEREIVSASNEPKPRRKRAASAVAKSELVTATVRVLREANEALSCREVASRLGITDPTAYARLRRAVAVRFVERVGRLYRASSAIPAFQ